MKYDHEIPDVPAFFRFGCIYHDMITGSSNRSAM